jgi:YidC/Oxa1 family membrane protein insertase
MDRNQIIGLVVMMVFITVYFTFFAPEPPQEVTETPTSTVVNTPQDSINNQESALTQLSDSAKAEMNQMKYGVFSSVAVGQEQKIALTNKDVKITFSSKGGVISEAQLLNYKDYLGQPILLNTPANSDISLVIKHLGKEIDIHDFYYQVKQFTKGDTALLSFQMDLNEYTWIRMTYSLPPSGFAVGFNLESKGMNELMDENIVFAWTQKYNRLEMDINDARSRSTVRYRTLAGDVDYLNNTSVELEEETVEEPVKWIALKQKFFTSAVIANDQFKSIEIASRVDEVDTTSIKEGTMRAVVPYEQFVAGKLGLTYYFGPNDFDIMKKVTPDFEENVNMGWSILSFINKYFVRIIFNFLERFFSNYGVIILIMVVIVRIILSPLTYKSHMSMAKMRVLKPELDAIKEKFPDDMQKAQQEQMALYRQVGINPLSGCIPMLLQMPILFSLFYFFPNAIELRQQGFLWSSDLSTYDNVLNLPFTIPFYGDHVSLFTLLMTVSTILYTWSNSQITTVTGPMKTMQYLMPVIFLFFLNSFSSGLTFYYFVSNMSTFGQTFLFRRFIDEDKIKSILEENKKKNANKSKSKFQLRLEEAMKANQEAQKKKKKR